jgi:hypothetical protein
MSPCASTQISPAVLPSRRRKSAVAATDPAAESGRRPGRAAGRPSRTRRGTSVQTLAHASDVADVFLVRIAFVLRFGDRRREIARIDDLNAERGQTLSEGGDEEGRPTHVHTATIASEIERNADDMHGFRHI